MKQFIDVLVFEFLGYARKKSYIITTVVLALLAGLTIYSPRFAAVWQEITGSGQTAEQEQNFPIIAVSGKENTLDPQNTEKILNEVLKNGKSNKLVYVDKANREQNIEKVKSGEYSKLVEISNDTTYNLVTLSLGLSDTLSKDINFALTKAFREAKLSKLGVSEADMKDIVSVTVKYTEESLKSNSRDTFFATYIIMFIIYTLIAAYGSHVSVGIAYEKTNRAVEILTISADTNALMFGKVIGIGLASILQISVIAGVSGISFWFSKDYIVNAGEFGSMFIISPSMMIYMMLFFVCGFFIYAFLFAITGALAAKIEDINTIAIPISIIMFVSFMGSLSFIVSDNGIGLTAKIFSYFPLTAPWAMFMRVTTGDAPMYEAIISLFVMVAFIFAEGILTAKIYNISILNYGNMKFRKVFASVFFKNK